MFVHVQDYISGAGDADADDLLLLLNNQNPEVRALHDRSEPSAINGCRARAVVLAVLSACMLLVVIIYHDFL